VSVVFYVNSLGLLGWWVRGSLLRREMPSVGQLHLFDYLVPLWGAVERRITPSFGLSLVCVAEKQGSGGAEEQRSGGAEEQRGGGIGG
jgi:hypothetical protein